MKIRKLLLTIGLLTPLFMVGCKSNPKDSEKVSSETSSEKITSSSEKERTKLPEVTLRLITGSHESGDGLSTPYDASLQEVEVEGFDEGKMVITHNSVLSATDVGNYKVTLQIKDTNKYTWSDGTDGFKEFNWSITKIDESSFVDYYLEINGQQVRSDEIDKSVTLPAIEQRMDIAFYAQFSDGGEYSYIPASYELEEENPNVSISGPYIYVTRFWQKVQINASCDNQNLGFEEISFKISFTEASPQTISINPGQVMMDNYGIRYELKDQPGYFTFYMDNEDYFMALDKPGRNPAGGFVFTENMKIIHSISITFHDVGCLTTIQCFPSLNNTTYIEKDGDIKQQKTTADIVDNVMTFEFNDSDFEEGQLYYAKFWYWTNVEDNNLELAPKIKSIAISFEGKLAE